MPCPQGIKIPEIFKGYDTASMFGDFTGFTKRYNEMEVNASACVGCGSCVAACPRRFEDAEFPRCSSRSTGECFAK